MANGGNMHTELDQIEEYRQTRQFKGYLAAKDRWEQAHAAYARGGNYARIINAERDMHRKLEACRAPRLELLASCMQVSGASRMIPGSGVRKPHKVTRPRKEPAMAQRTQFALALALVGLVVLAVLWDAATAVEGALLYAALLTAGILLVRASVRKRV
jgi:hypothetical protein